MTQIAPRKPLSLNAMTGFCVRLVWVEWPGASRGLRQPEEDDQEPMPGHGALRGLDKSICVAVADATHQFSRLPVFQGDLLRLHMP